MAPFVRILLRILAGYLIGRGADPALAELLYTDPQFVGAVTLAVSEGWYFLARKYGWEK